MFVLVHVNGYPIPEHDRRDDGQDPALAAVAAETDTVLVVLEAARAQLGRSAGSSSASSTEGMQTGHADRRNSPDHVPDRAGQAPDDGR